MSDVRDLALIQQFVGGYKGDWEKAPSGQNQESKLQLLKEEGVLFDANGFLVDKTLLWDEFNAEKLR
jgi:methylated-DNA-[protein]-cysteine S-methyltransferase